MGTFSTLIDLTGRRFGRWTVVSRAASNSKHVRWNAVCDCGTRSAVIGNNMKRGISTACAGCRDKPKKNRPQKGSRSLDSDLAGRRFGALTVIELIGRSGRQRLWMCRCDCGTTGPSTTYQLTHADPHACECGKPRRPSSASNTGRLDHGHSRNRRGSPEYRVWQSMIQRCTNPARANYGRYGGRGISVCDRWRRFVNFLADMGPRPDGTTLDRVDSDGNYEPGNCRWATLAQQATNTRRTVLVAHNGETRCIAEWARIVGIKQSTVWNRIKAQGMTPHDALFNDGPRPPLTIGARSLTLTQWERQTGIPRKTIASRLQWGWRPEDAIAFPAGTRFPGARGRASADAARLARSIRGD